MASLLRKLETQGYLSLSAFCEYLTQYVPHAAISYPTAVKYAKEGKLQTLKVGSQHRVLRREVERWVTEGSQEVAPQGPSPSPTPY